MRTRNFGAPLSHSSSTGLRCAGLVASVVFSLNVLAAETGGDFPAKAVRWIVPYPASGGIDLVARVVTPRLSSMWSQPVIIDNRPGGGGRLGTQAAANSPGDGYTQLFSLNTNYTIDKSMFKTMMYDPEKAFDPITIIASTPQILVSNPSFPVKNVKQLIALAKARPGQINYGSSGVGGSLHFAMEYFRTATGIDMVHVPYKGGPPAATDLIAGNIQVLFFNLPASLPYLKSGRLKALGVSTIKRSEMMPELPTIAEQGVPGFDIDVWYGLAVPAGTPAAAARKTYQDITQIIKTPDVRKQLLEIGAEPVFISPEDMAKRIRSESAKWAKVIRASKMVFD
jgi:tripartite-type tricarboxylate transporter receptor subunit TctC